MPEFLAAAALLPEGWAEAVLILADADGTITAVAPGTARAPAADRLRGAVIAGMPNLHSHAFQRAMAGGAERRSPAGQDSFWTWRETMYRFVGLLGPEDAEAVAAMLYVELLEQGFTERVRVPLPAPPARRHALCRPGRDGAAPPGSGARDAGIGMTLLPCLYRHGGIFGKPAAPGQRRFLNDLDGFAAILAAAATPWRATRRPRSASRRTACAPSRPAMLQAVAAMDGPVHIHAAEQPREVEECLAAVHARPVEWLLDNAPVDPRWCVIHATHMSAPEIEDLAASGAVAGLCPSTEASLGDGVFALPAYLGHGGRLGIGTDSHVGTAPREELRLLETSQRLALQARSVAATEAAPHPGRLLLDAALAGGAQASGRRLGAIAPGMRCDLVELDTEHPALVGRGGDALLDAWIFGPAPDAVRTVVCGGKRVVEAGRHLARLDIAERFGRTMRRLLA